MIIESDSDDEREADDEAEEANDERAVPETDLDEVPETETNEAAGSDSLASSNRPRLRRNLPARFRKDAEEPEDDGILCAICGLKEPDDVKDEVIFWIDCEKCDKWAHNKCVFGKNSVSKKYVCQQCSNSNL